ncbi:MAG: fatty acid desaturase [Acidimicrobiales bacterium]
MADTDRLAALQARQASRRTDAQDRLAPAPAYRGVPDLPAWRNPTMYVAAGAVVGWTVGWVGYLVGAVPAGAAIAANAVACYLGFTVFHESVHRTAHPNRAVNDALGWLPALLLTFTYPVFRSCHLNHHAHTNDPATDPDHFVAKRPAALRPIWLLGTAVQYRVLCYRHEWSTAGWRRAQKLFDVLIVGSLPVAALTGHLAEVLVLFWAPAAIAGLVLFYAFDYLPHYPFDSTERYHNTRIQPGRLRHALLLGQNYHLIHHLWVSVPWFHYRRVYTDLEASLAAKHIRVDGRRRP